MFFVLRKSFLQQGFRGIYTGLTASLLRQMTYSLVRIGSYEAMKEKLSQNGCNGYYDVSGDQQYCHGKTHWPAPELREGEEEESWRYDGPTPSLYSRSVS